MDLIEHYIQQWDQKLSQDPWLCGEKVGFLDFALWGHLQCMTSGLTDELIPLLKNQTYLIKWLEAISLLSLDLPLHYTNRLLDLTPKTLNSHCRLGEKIIFWCTFIMLILLFPLTLMLITLSLQRRYKNPFRSGALL